MPSGTCCAPVVPGVCCLTTGLPGNRSTTTFGFGGELGPGRGFTTRCSPRCGGSWAASPAPAGPSSTAGRCRPRKKGASGVRRGPAGARPQTAYCGGYPGAAVGGGGAPSRRARPGWAKLVISKLTGRFPRLSLIWADGGYAGKLIEWVATLTGWTLAIVRRPGNRHSFEVLPRRWVVERTFAWLGWRRRLSKDYEALPETTEAWVYTAMTGLMLRRLARPPAF